MTYESCHFHFSASYQVLHSAQHYSLLGKNGFYETVERCWYWGFQFVFRLVFLGLFFFLALWVSEYQFFISPLIYCRWCWSSSQAGGGVYTLNRPPVCCRVNTERRITTHSHIHTPAANLQSPVNLMSLSLSCVRKLECLEKVHCVDQSHSGDKCRLVQLYLGEGDISAAERLPLTGWFA